MDLEAQHRAIHARVHNILAEAGNIGKLVEFPGYYFLDPEEIREINKQTENQDENVVKFVRNVLHNESNQLPPFLRQLETENKKELIEKLLSFYTYHKLNLQKFKNI